MAGLHLTVKALRRESRRRSEVADGLLIELERTGQPRKGRITYNSNAVHNNPLATGL